MGNGCRAELELHTRHGAILLKVTSGLHTGFRFELNRHNFATETHNETLERRLSRDASTQVQPRPGRDSRHPPSAEALSKG